MRLSRRAGIDGAAGAGAGAVRPGWARRGGSGARGRALASFALLAILLGGSQSGAEAPDSGAQADGPPAPAADRDEVLGVPPRPTGSLPGSRTGSGDPGLDALLRLPSDFETQRTSKPVAGASEEEWRRRFDRAEKAIGEAREALTKSRQELDGLAETGGASQWSVAPPGAAGAGNNQTTSPLSFKLRQEIQRNRQALDEAEKALRELRIEADLAGVPAEWRVVAAGEGAPGTRDVPAEN